MAPVRAPGGALMAGRGAGAPRPCSMLNACCEDRTGCRPAGVGRLTSYGWGRPSYRNQQAERPLTPRVHERALMELYQ